MPTTNTPTLWNVPYQRNPFFTGREEELNRLHRALQADAIVALSHPQGISGLGGIGKTQTALEYAYRYRSDYHAVFWVRADSITSLTSSMVELAHVLELPERDAQDQEIIVRAVLRWLRLHPGWLLIYDNIDKLSIAEPFLPKAGPGHLLFTTRARSLGGIAEHLDIQKMEPDIGALLLLRRASLLALQAALGMASPEDQGIARAISQELDGLPLALDQAGAYIKEAPCPLPDYLTRYQTRRSDILRERGGFDHDYPASVATTWSLSFEKVSQANPSASDLLDFCSFLYPDAIPEEMITAGAEHLPPQLQASLNDELQFNALIAVLLAYSLIYRSADDCMLNIHRLVQVVLKDTMNKEERKAWGYRTIRVVDEVFPLIEFKMWSQCERCLPHAQVCVGLIEQEEITSPEAVHLLNQTGYYLYKRGRYREVEPLFERLLLVLDQSYSTDHNTSVALNNLALLYYSQGKYENAEQLLQRALSIEEKVSGREHPAVANVLNSLAGLYYAWGRFSEAEPLYTQALTILEQKLGTQHPDTLQSIHNLAALYRTQGKHIQAEPLLQQTLMIREKVLGPGHPDTATSLLNLAEFYYEQGRFDEAEPMYQRALEICEQELGPQHPDTAVSLSGLAKLYDAQHKYDEAEFLYQRALSIEERQLETEHPSRALILHNLAAHYQKLDKLSEAESLYQQALAIRKHTLGSQHPDIATNLYNLAIIYKKQSRFAEAELMYQQALAIYELRLGPNHSLTTRARESYIQLLRRIQQENGTARLEA